MTAEMYLLLSLVCPPEVSYYCLCDRKNNQPVQSTLQQFPTVHFSGTWLNLEKFWNNWPVK